MPSSRSLNVLFNRVARIAATTVRAPAALVTVRRERKLNLLGAHGLYINTLDDSWGVDSVLVRRSAMVYAANVRRDPNFKNHPLFNFAPFTRSLVHIPVSGVHSEIEVAISIVNPEIKWPFTSNISGILNDLVMLVADAMVASEHDEERAERSMQEVATPSPAKTKTADTAGKFLLATLPVRTSIRSRKDVSYVTLRTWSKSIKAHQLAALKIAKADPDTQFVEDVAREMATYVRRLFGISQVGCVVPVPCGHSKTNECFSVRIAQSLAKKLDVSFVDALQHTAREGSSHPNKNAKLKLPKLLEGVANEAVLLVDDVATSGRHIELAVQSLRQMANNVTAIAWIGAS